MTGAVHANVTAVAVGGRALLITGAPGSGKSALALSLIDRGATLIGDDAVTLDRQADFLIAGPPPNTAGMLEIRNVGIVQMSVTSAPVALVLSLHADAARYPLEVGTTRLEGVDIPILPFAAGDAAQALRAEYALSLQGLPFPRNGERPTRDADG